jgi:16S rRNA (uracil1498-N3)-methyltransferase
MLRRVHIRKLHVGSIALEPAEAHHLRDVLRLAEGAAVELFDDAGQTATAVILHVNPANVVVQVESIESTASGGPRVTVAAAVPKGDRADWMVEKLTELGVSRFIPLVTERSVTVPAGKNKIQRWERIAIEAAKQSRRAGVMSIAPLTPLDQAIATASPGIFLSTAGETVPLNSTTENDPTLFVGPEGGWSDPEMDRMRSAGFSAAALTSSILRVETAAVLAAGIAMLRGRIFELHEQRGMARVIEITG